MYDIIASGSATVDVFLKTTGEELIDIKTRDSEEIFTCYPLGSKMLVKELQFMTGGGGTNTAVSFSRMGLKTAYLGNVGEDANGSRVIEEVKKEGVDFIGTRGKQQTNYSVILDSIGHDRTILVYRDASDRLDFSKLKKSKLKAGWLYFSSMRGKSFGTAVRLAKLAEKNSTKVAYNPSSYQVKEGAKKLRPLLERTDVLIFNREEASLLTGLRKETPIEKLLKAVRDLGPKLAVITEGSKGASCSDGINVYKIKPGKIKIMETTGAGDAFASGFVAALARGRDIEFSLRLGLANAVSVIKHYGAKNRLLKWDEAQKKAGRGPKVSRKKARPQ